MIQKLLIGIAIIVSAFSASANSDGSTYENSGNSVSAPLPPPGTGSYYDWGRGRDGTGYCYQFTWDGYVLNGGAPQPNFNCEQSHPSHYDWGRGNNGYGYCYQFTPYNVVMNMGAAQPNNNCEVYRPSYYRWGRGNNGYTYCFQFTADGLVMNDGRSVPNNYCY